MRFPSLFSCIPFQPSPVKLTVAEDGGGNNITLSSSFALFNQSFDMNLEGLLGTDPALSFGLGPTGSLSFGLGLGTNSIDYGDNGSYNNNGNQHPAAPRWSPRQSYPRMSPLRMMASDDDASGGGGSGGGGGSMRPPLPAADEMATSAPPPGSNVQLLGDSTPSSPFGDVIATIDGAATRPPPAVAEKANGRPCDLTDAAKQRGTRPRSRNVNQTELFGVIARHSVLFDKFSFLFPGARAILNDGAAFGSRDIFDPRDREVALRRVNAALCAFGGETILCGSPDEMPPDSKRLRRMRTYREAMAERFYEDENRLSWEIEEDPPIELSDSDEGVEDDSIDSKRFTDDDDRKFTSSLQRNIGVMVYPAVNAFTATEPGIITPALSEMNNFVDLNNSLESYPSKAHDEMTLETYEEVPPLVSPDFIRQGTHAFPRSPLLKDGETPQRSVNYAGGAYISKMQSPRKVTPGKKCDSESTDLLFVDAQKLQPEQFRTISQKKRPPCDSRFLYPALPLPYGQRKRISNAMFAMSKSVPGLTDECAAVLREARKKDAWDFAVAQLMTQVVVVTHCSIGDSKLDGLSMYLLTLG